MTRRVERHRRLADAAGSPKPSVSSVISPSRWRMRRPCARLRGSGCSPAGPLVRMRVGDHRAVDRSPWVDEEITRRAIETPVGGGENGFAHAIDDSTQPVAGHRGTRARGAAFAQKS